LDKVEAPARDAKRDLKWVFVGSGGLRAGWGVALFVLIAVLIFVLLIVLLMLGLHALFPHGHAPPPRPKIMTAIPAALSEGLLFLSFGLATLIMALIERRPVARFGFGAPALGPRFAQGFATGFVLMAVLVGVLWGLHAVAFDGLALRGAPAVISGLSWIGVFLLVGASEEIAMRGYLLQTLARGLNFRWAMLISSLLFTALHIPNGGETPFGLSQVFLIGVVFSLSVWKTGSLWWAIGYHAAWDWTQSFVFGVADSGEVISGALMKSHPTGPPWLSGGPTGPEGSWLALAAVGATAAIVVLVLKPRGQALEVRW
jgi:membrane protease YdiL (CAAX protease family)